MREIINTVKAPQAIGPYSQGVKVKCGTLLYLSGQIPLNPQTGEVVGKSAGEQCQQVMDNIQQLLAAGGATFGDVVKTTIFLADLKDFAIVNEMYATYFDSRPPARSTVEVSRLPKDVKIEIEIIAAL